MFGNIIRSNGFSVDCLFYKRSTNRATMNEVDLELKLHDFDIDEVQNSYRLSFIDPGRQTVFTAAEGVSTKAHNLLRCYHS